MDPQDTRSSHSNEDHEAAACIAANSVGGRALSLQHIAADIERHLEHLHAHLEHLERGFASIAGADEGAAPADVATDSDESDDGTSSDAPRGGRLFRFSMLSMAVAMGAATISIALITDGIDLVTAWGFLLLLTVIVAVLE